MLQNLVSILSELAVVPSFSSREEVIHPVLKRMTEPAGEVVWHRVPENNLVGFVRGDLSRRPVALSAHLDKINHFGESPPEKLPYHSDSTHVTGQMDNAVGLAICVAVARLAGSLAFPPLMLLFSEMEESFGLKHHPHLLKNGGAGLHHGIGAERITHYLLEKKIIPSSVITVDTTPLFKGERGVALYSGHWEFTGCNPAKKEKEQTERIRDELLAADPDIKLANNTNDYLHYGVEFNRNKRHGVASLAVEPAIFPYHQKNESVYLEDIERVYRLLVEWLENTG